MGEACAACNTAWRALFDGLVERDGLDLNTLTLLAGNVGIELMASERVWANAWQQLCVADEVLIEALRKRGYSIADTKSDKAWDATGDDARFSKPREYADPVRVLAELMYQTHSALLCGRPTPAQDALYRRMKDPKPGEWVVEITSLHRNGWPRSCFGRLILTRQEPLDNPEWDEQRDGPKPLYPYWYIETVDGRLARWWNCSFISVGLDFLRDEDVTDRERWAKDAFRRHGLGNMLASGGARGDSMTG